MLKLGALHSSPCASGLHIKIAICCCKLCRLFLRSHRVKGSPHAVSLFYPEGVIIHLVDGTYELFRHFYGLRRFTKGEDRPYGAVVGVLQTVLQMMRPRKRLRLTRSEGE